MADARSNRHWTTIGWSATLLGCGLWTYGYFAGGSPPIIEWSAFTPNWISEYLPNWQAELGIALAVLGSIPLYHAQIQDYWQRE